MQQRSKASWTGSCAANSRKLTQTLPTGGGGSWTSPFPGASLCSTSSRLRTKLPRKPWRPSPRASGKRSSPSSESCGNGPAQSLVKAYGASLRAQRSNPDPSSRHCLWIATAATPPRDDVAVSPCAAFEVIRAVEPVNAFGVLRKDLLAYFEAQIKRIDIALRVIIILACQRINTAHRAHHLGGEKDIPGWDYLEQQLHARFVIDACVEEDVFQHKLFQRRP